MDIGTLTGQIEIEDQLSDKLTEIASHVRHFAESFGGVIGGAAIGVGVLTAAIGGAITSVVSLGERGSTLLDVEGAFDRLAVAAGTTGEALRGGLSEGVKSTVSEMELMQTTSRLLTSGMKLTAENTLLMGQAARAMGKATGTDAAGGLATLSSALLTGRVRSLAMAGVIVDTKKAEEEYAKSLGVTAAELSREGKLHADRIAILAGTEAYVKRLGESQLSFKERIQQSEVSMAEWTEKLEKSVASSPHVMAALDAIENAIHKAFGGASQSLLDTIVGWVNNFADAVTTYGPPIIQTIADIWHGIENIWGTVKKAWSDVPQWFKDITVNAALAGGSVLLLSDALKVTTGSDLLGSLSNMAQVWSVVGSNVLSATKWTLGYFSSVIALGWGGLVVMIEDLGAALKAAGVAAWSATGPLALVAAGIAAIWAAWKVGHWDSVSDFFEKAGLLAQGYTLAQADAMIATDHATQAQIKSANALKGLYIPAIVSSHGAVAGLVPPVGDLNKGMIDQTAAATKAAAAHKLLKAELEAMRKPFMDINEAASALEESFQNSNAARVLAEGLAFVASAADDAAQKMDELDSALSDIASVASRVYTESLSPLRKSMEGLATDLTQLSQVSGDSFGGFVKGIAEVVVAWNLASSAADEYRKAAEDGNKAAQALALVKGAIAVASATSSGSTTKRVVGGALAGAEIGSVFGPWGTAIGGAIGGLTGLIRGLGGVSQAVKETRLQQDGLIKSLQGVVTKGQITEGALTDNYHTIAIVARDAFLKTGSSADAADAHVRALLDPDHPAAFKAAVLDLNRALDQSAAKEAQISKLISDRQAAIDGVQGAMDKWKLTIVDMGPAWKQQELDKGALSLWQDYQLLTAAGADHITILKHMAQGYQDVVTQSLITGSAIPANLKPAVEELARMGLLTDEAGNKMTDISKLTWTDTLEGKFQMLLDKIGDLVDALNYDLTGAIKNLPDKTVHVNVETSGITNAPDYGGQTTPVYAAGGYGNVVPFRPRGSDTVPAMLTPGESVNTVAETKFGQNSKPMVIQLIQDGKKTAEVIVPYLPGAVKRMVG